MRESEQMQQESEQMHQESEQMREQESNDVFPTEVMARVERLGLVGAFTLYDEMAAKQRVVQKRYHVTARTKAYLGVKDAKERNQRLLRVMTDRWALVQVLSTPYREVQLLWYIRDLLYVAAYWQAMTQKA